MWPRGAPCITHLEFSQDREGGVTLAPNLSDKGQRVREPWPTSPSGLSRGRNTAASQGTGQVPEQQNGLQNVSKGRQPLAKRSST